VRSTLLSRVFVADNGGLLKFDQVEAILMVQALAGGNLTEQELAQWFRSRLEDARG
jgi:prophage maintenance system killer protein